MQRSLRLLALVLSLGLLLVSWSTNSYAQPNAEEPVVQSDFGATNVAWSVPQGSGAFILVVSGPDGYRFEQTFQSGVPLAFQAVDAAGAPLADGLYVYELTQVQFDATNKARAIGEDGRDAALTRELTQSRVSPSVTVSPVSGAFTIQSGSILDPNAVEEQTQAPAQSLPSDSPASIDAPADVVHADDVIVQGSLCAGFDCVNGESFGADTIRLKENNLRIHFEDTSSTGSFPSNDWRITANDQASGGANYFSIDDVTGAKVPFKLTAGAPSNSFFMDSSGRLGLRTSTPVLDLHISTGNTPATRLEQNGSSGFTAQTWDLAGNEANFFIRDVTNGSRLPFRIAPGAPTSSIHIASSGNVGVGTASPTARLDVLGDIAASGNVGVGTASPSASLHVQRTDGTAKVFVEEASGTSATRTLMELKNNGKIFFTLNDTRVTDPVEFANNNGGFNIKIGGTNKFIQATNGNVTIVGNLTLSGGSCTGCRTAGQVWAMSRDDIMSRLANLSITQVASTATDVNHLDSSGQMLESQVIHLFPNTQSFYDSYGLGLNGEQIAPLDVATVSLAAVQALQETILQQQALIEAQAVQLAELEARLERVESMSHAHTYLPAVTR